MSAKGRTWSHELEVVGLRFRFKLDGRRALSDMIDKRGSIKGVRLIREPDNRADPNAIMVCLPKRILGGTQLGYLRALAAEHLAWRIDKGILEVVTAELDSLDAKDEWNTGSMVVRFRDVKQPKKIPQRKNAKRAGTASKRSGMKSKR